MRLLFLAAALGAFPFAASAQVATSLTPESPALAAEVSDESERLNTVSGVLGGEGLSLGVGYERRLLGPMFARTGFQYYTNGSDIRGRFVPLTLGAVKGLGGRWSADASGGATVAFMHNDGEAIPELGIEATPQDYVRVVPNLGLGVRYEAEQLFLRGGAVFFPQRFDRIQGESARWAVLPWPSLSAGFRF